MTGNGIVTLAKSKVKDALSSFDWNTYFAMVIDEIFSAKEWRFARQEMNYIHSASTFEYQMSTTVTEKALNKLIGAYYTTAYTLVLGVPVPTANTSQPLEYWPYSDFIRAYPDHQTDGQPDTITEIIANDGTNGMKIGLYPRPSSDAAVWIYGDFKPSYTIDGNPLPILPLQFHRLVYLGLVREAADDKGRDKLYAKAARDFDKVMGELDDWDRRQPIYRPRFQEYTSSPIRKRPFYPSNFDASVSR